MKNDKKYDAIVIGAGLSGLACGIRLQSIGKKVLIVEKKPQPGGRCKHVDIDDLSFEVGVNDFGNSVEKMLSELGIQHPFKKVKTRLIFGDQYIDSPIDLASLRTLFYPRDLFRLLYNMFFADNQKSFSTVTHSLQNVRFRNMVHAMVAYFLFRRVDQISIALAKRSFNNEYGYEDARVPIGGNQPLIDKFVNRFNELGGTIRYSTKYLEHSAHSREEGKSISLRDINQNINSIEQADVVISCHHGWKRYPEETPPSFSVAALLAEMNPDFQLPNDVHTFVFLPEDVELYLKEHDQGILSKSFGFHWFKHHPIEQSNKAYALTAYVLSPRNLIYSKENQSQVVKYIIETTNNYFPGFKDAVMKKIFVPPDQYKQHLGIKSQLVPRLVSKPFHLDYYDSRKDMYYIGNAVNALHEQHAGGALSSAKEAVREIIRQEKWPAHLNLSEPKKQTSASNLALVFYGIIVCAVLAIMFKSTDMMNVVVDIMNRLLHQCYGKANFDFEGWTSFWHKRPEPANAEMDEIPHLGLH